MVQNVAQARTCVKPTTLLLAVGAGESYLARMMAYRDCALILAGHGSTVNADSSAPTFEHAESIRGQGLFAEVHECFWKEEPNYRRIWAEVESPFAYVVPTFIGEGYFTQEVLPRELGLKGRRTRRGEMEIRLCDPVGLHPGMTELLIAKASQAVAASAATPGPEVSLIVCGHGTGLNANSMNAVREQVERLRATSRYTECIPAAMDEVPFIRDWRTLARCRDVIVVPFFVSDGMHTARDIPLLMGMNENAARDPILSPHHEPDGRRLWYAGAIGQAASIADIILAQVRHFDETYGTIPPVA